MCKWILPSKKMPKPSDAMITNRVWCYSPFLGRCAIGWHIPGHGWMIEGATGTWDVTHWSPLLEPPKGK